MQRMKFRGYQLFYNNRDVAESMVRQIDEFPSFFTPQGDRPLIIDCGSNIGVSMLEWKTRWPTSQILCFEPDPFAFKVLQKNIEFNDIPGVQCVNAALLDCEEVRPFFGQLSATADARGNSIDAAWARRDGSSETTVNCKRLSTFLANRDVSFLKLDIEGAEQRVLSEIAEHLHRIESIYVEVHETRENADRNSVAEIKRLLSDAGFTVETEERFGDRSLPAHLDAWQQRVEASQTQLLCWR